MAQAVIDFCGSFYVAEIEIQFDGESMMVKSDKLSVNGISSSFPLTFGSFWICFASKLLIIGFSIVVVMK